MTEHKYTNKLANEKSPYLLQHAHNPIDWYPWGEEAFGKASYLNLPIFLSIGYSTCHWCHVMERESFEDAEVAQILNKNFISIKVDREERPDIDHIYMEVCQALTGQGGWPLTILMTPDKKPFYAGTYFPKHDRARIPGLMTLLDKVTDAWKKDSYSLIESGEKIVEAISQLQPRAMNISGEELIHDAYSNLSQDFDDVYGGFGSAPKFPTPHNLYFLLRYWYVYRNDHALEMVEKTLDKMHKGGIFDHIAGGFSRYSVDQKWLVPHFEKMLYDNSLLAIAFIETYQATKKMKYANIAKRIFEYVTRDMLSPEGGFYSAEDADSEGIEGKFYVWTPEEIKQVLGERDGEWFCKYYDITKSGNFEGFSIPNLIKSAIPASENDFVGKCRKKLFDHREKRVHPYKDDKILTSWNGLMISAMAIGGRILDDESLINTAEKSVDFIFKNLVREDGRLLARYRDGDSAYLGYVDDYSFLIWGLIELYETTYKPQYLEKALQLNKDLIRLFWDDENGGLFLYGSDSEQLITRPKEIYDGAMPSGNSVATYNFLRLSRLTGQQELEDRALRQFKTFGKAISTFPRGYAFSLIALLYAQTTSMEVVLVDKTKSQTIDKMAAIINEKYSPFTISMIYTDELKDIKLLAPFITNYKPVDGKATSYICEGFSCQAPITDLGEFKRAFFN